ncbi:hypothetical protein BSP109_03371, partial [Brevibacterium sp. Mu109]
TLDGLLVPLTETTWVRSGAVLGPEDRISALAAQIPARLVVSHSTAWWVHVGLGRAPSPLTFTTHPRRRVLDQDGAVVHELNLGRGDWETIAGLPVTTPMRRVPAAVPSMSVPSSSRRPRTTRGTTSAPMGIPTSIPGEQGSRTVRRGTLILREVGVAHPPRPQPERTARSHASHGMDTGGYSAGSSGTGSGGFDAPAPTSAAAPVDAQPTGSGRDEDEYDPETDLDITDAPQVGVAVIAKVLGGEIIHARDG